MASAIGNALNFETDYDRHEQRHRDRLETGRKLRVLHLFSGPAPHELQKEIEVSSISPLAIQIRLDVQGHPNVW